MILKKNKRYILRNGLMTKPLYFNEKCGTNYKFESDIHEEHYDTPTKCAWLHNGRFVANSIEHPLDIVSEFQEDN